MGDVRAEEPGEREGGEEILVVDDSATIARLLELQLQQAGYLVRVASNGQQALDAVAEHVPDLVLADVMMPEMDGMELTRHLRENPRTAGVNVILITARGMSADKLEGLSAGADDYIVKPYDPAELLVRVGGVLRRTKELKAQSPLTRLPGNIRIQEEIQRRVESGADFALLYADLDNFKAYNDYYGFLRGDDVLQMTARLIREVAVEIGGPETFVGHVGGDDFVVVTTSDRARPIAEALVERFDQEAPALYDAEDQARGYIEKEDRAGELQRFPFVSISIGIATSEKRKFSHYAEAVAVATEMKSFAKKTVGSSWDVDKRG